MGENPSWPSVMRTTLRLWFERRGLRIHRRGVAGLAVLLIVGLAVALGVVLSLRPGAPSASMRPKPSPTRAKPAPQPPDPATLREETALRGQAAAWVAQQVSPAAVVSCDPAMCGVLQAHGVPSSQLLVLLLADADPLGSDVVVATPTVRSQFGSRLITVYAPEVIASFGSGATRIDIRAIAPDGAAAFQSAVAADASARIVAGNQLLRNKRLAVSAGARSALTSGEVDPRLLVTLAALAAQQRVSVASFGDPSPDAPGVPLRSADLTAATKAQSRMLLSFLHAQDTPYLPAVAVTQATGARFTITIQYDAPGPLGMGGEL
jgi:hypothetical protein